MELTVNINHKITFHNEQESKLVVMLKSLLHEVNKMSVELETLVSEVAEIKTVSESAITLLVGLKAKLDEAIASNDPQALIDLSNSLDASSKALAEAIAANTPAEV
jgi:hypothetical protein